MVPFATLDDLKSACLDLPTGSPAAAAAVASREARLTKPAGALGRLEEMVGWLAYWQDRSPPRLDRVDVLVFAGNHGVASQGISAYSAEVTAQMVENFAAGGAAINQLAHAANAGLRVIALSLDAPTADFTQQAAMDERDFLAAVSEGYRAVSAAADLVCLGEMGIGNTTSAAAIAAALFGGEAGRFAGRGTGLDDAGVVRKRAVIAHGLARHAEALADPLQIAAALGGRELAAILGATLAARRLRIPVLLDGFVATAAVAPLAKLRADALAHAMVGHVSAEDGHRALLAALEKRPLLDLSLRLGEASGAALAVLIMRAALACHTGMATFAEAGVSDRASNDGPPPARSPQPIP